MRLLEYMKLFSTLAPLVFMAGCILPLPHTRVVRPECEGFVSDNVTGRPIPNATVVVVYEDGRNTIVHTDSSGHWRIPCEKTWHTAVLMMPPTGYSLVPCFGGEHLPCKITIEAEGYDKWEWTSFMDKDTIDALSKSIGGPTEIVPVVDRRNARLKQKCVFN